MSWKDKLGLNRPKQPIRKPQQIPRSKPKTCNYKRIRRKRSDGYEDSIRFSEGCTPEDKARIMEGIQRKDEKEED